MDKADKEGLLADGYQRYEVAHYRPEENLALDRAATKVPCPWWIEGSDHELAAGGKDLQCHIDLEDDWFVVYLPPEDPDWGARSQIPVGRPPGFRPSSATAKREFHRWVKYITPPQAGPSD